jgi:hypothetical protein
MGLKVWELPWQPTVLISGRSYYTVRSTAASYTAYCGNSGLRCQQLA